MSKPIDLSEEQLRAAAEGRGEEAFGASKPVDLSEEELRIAAQGRAGEVMKGKTGA
jgi:hypothetical protein